MSGRVWGNEYRTTIVCVDSYENGVLAGRFYNPYLPEGERFESLTEFLLKMEDLLDSMKLPQSFTAARTFGSPPQRDSDGSSGGTQKDGALATFAVRVLFRQNTSWQGSVAWLHRDMEESYRSVLELVLLMDSALRTARNSEST